MPRNVLITGACGGIGRALCQSFIAAGDHVLALDIHADELRKLSQQLGEEHCHPIHADITDAQAMHLALSAACAQFGEVQVIVANAGAAQALTLQNTTEASWKNDIDLNLNGCFNTIEALRPRMQNARQGNIVIIGSVNGLSAFGHPAYSVAKAGLVGYTKALAMELGAYGIRANLVCPGTVKTQAWQARADKNPQVFEDLKQWYPLGDFATPEDIANATLFLASDAARVITGVVLPVDGGLMAGNRVFARDLIQEDI